ncbi:NfeD family protein [Bowmanella dokdonensis]|uniref:NfeD family protein n=1 Tax=Bowmanella dokdonensis TaxID=751969 RepID=A0A939DQC8_9ALTE|nr:NfeD family protein [Bowmanella dokdonensis]MBN7825986.1 NfeD family protein [Bowmanella dokdonensis]
MDDMASHLPEALMILGLLLLAIEILVLGFSTFVLLYIGLSALVVGGMMNMDWLPISLFSAIGNVAILSAVLAMLLWRPMKRYQGYVEKKDVTNDMVGYRFNLPEDLNSGSSIPFRYSGILWQVRSSQDLAANQEVEVVRVAVGVLEVKAAE